MDMKGKLLLPLIAIVCSAVAFNSCSKIADAIAQSFTWQGIDVIIDVPASSDTGSYATIGTGSFVYDFDSLIKDKTANQFGLKNIKSFTFKSCTLTILDPDTLNNFANFRQAKASFSTSTNPTTTVLGEVTNNPDVYATSLNLPINNTTNIKSYLPSSGKVTLMYDLSGQIRKPVTRTIKVQAQINYTIQVAP